MLFEQFFKLVCAVDLLTDYVHLFSDDDEEEEESEEEEEDSEEEEEEVTELGKRKKGGDAGAAAKKQKVDATATEGMTQHGQINSQC